MQAKSPEKKIIILKLPVYSDHTMDALKMYNVRESVLRRENLKYFSGNLNYFEKFIIRKR